MFWGAPRRAVPDRLLNEKACGLFGAQKGLNPPTGAVAENKNRVRTEKRKIQSAADAKPGNTPAPVDPLQNGAAILCGGLPDGGRHHCIRAVTVAATPTRPSPRRACGWSLGVLIAWISPPASVLVGSIFSPHNRRTVADTAVDSQRTIMATVETLGICGLGTFEWLRCRERAG